MLVAARGDVWGALGVVECYRTAVLLEQVSSMRRHLDQEQKSPDARHKTANFGVFISCTHNHLFVCQPHPPIPPSPSYCVTANSPHSNRH